MARFWTTLGTFMLMVAPLSAGEDKKPASPRVKKALEAVERSMADAGRRATFLWKDDKAVEGIFPEHVFVMARFRIYPVAMEIPAGLKPSNLFAVSGEGKVEHIKDTKGLEKFFGLNAKDFLTEKKVKDGLSTWLTLTQEFHQDGFYKFEVLEKEIQVEMKGEDFEVHGRAMVVGGGKGEIAATARFLRGQLGSVVEKVKIMEGPRPICQATKLLDADPIVRKMAERDLLFMGLAARDYLMEQREKAEPKLRRAMDELWERIVKNGW